jgi:hypothetical protein
MVARFEKEYIINNSSTDTAAAFVFNPFSGLVAWQTTPMVDDTNPVAWTVPAGSISHPGNSFLTANASWNRCLAACVQVYYPGSELSRAGVVSLGQYPAEVVNDTAAVATFRQMANYVVRTPSDCAEIVWRPNHADLLGREPIPLPSVLSNMAGTNTTSLVVTAAGLPVTTGIRIRVVAVYEWMPDPLAGFKNTVVRIARKMWNQKRLLSWSAVWFGQTSGSAHQESRSLNRKEPGPRPIRGVQQVAKKW